MAVADKVMHASLESDRGDALMASDLAPGMQHVPGNNVTMSLSGTTVTRCARTGIA
jgi:PhnB protein